MSVVLRVIEHADGGCLVCQPPAALVPSSGLRRLYIACDADTAGEGVQVTLMQRSRTAGIASIALSPRLGDFNENLYSLISMPNAQR